MDFQHQYFLSDDFNKKVKKIYQLIDSNNINKKEEDYLFQIIYPAIVNFLNMKKIANPDLMSDFIAILYENFHDFLIKSKNFAQDKENFIFYYYFIKYLYFEWQNFSRKLKSIKSTKENLTLEYIDPIKNENNIIAYDKKDSEDFKIIIKKCLKNHFELEEIIMFITYYYFLIDNEDYILISDFLNIPILNIIEIIDNEKKEENIHLPNICLSEDKIKILFNQDINSFRVAISRIKKKMKIKCNYLLENYLFIDEGNI